MRTNIHTRGYTLIELIVSVAIFTIVMLVAGAAFLAIISLDRQARATNDVVTNLSYVVDAMERSIRTGTNYSASQGSSFSFTNADGTTVGYRLNVTNGRGQVEQRTGSGSWTTLTDPRINVTNLTFYPRGTVPGDSVQASVIFVVRGVIQPDPDSPIIEFVIESAATQRLIDI